MAAKTVQDVRKAMGKPPAATGRVKKKKGKTQDPNPKGRRVLVLKDGRRRVFEWIPW